MFDKKITHRIILGVCLLAVFGLGMVTENALSYHVAQPGTIDFSLFWDAYNKLQQYYVDPSKINNQQVVYGAISGMTNSLGDPFTEFFDPEQAKLFNDDLAGSFSGIGAQIGITEGQLTIVSPIKGTPADKAGLESGDLILKINGQSTANMTIDQATDLIRGNKGTTVTLNILRSGWLTAKDFVITRDTIVVPPVTWTMKDGDVADITLSQFDETLPTDFKNIASQILASNAKYIVLDLRGNPGGYLDAAQDVAGYFIKSGQTVTIEDFGAGKQQQLYKALGNAELTNYPMVVLMDGGSASAAEILAGALRDDNGVQLIGLQSFGKGSVQQVIDLNGGSFLKITIAHWLTPKGTSINGVGLTPDVKVDITEQNVEANQDPQMDKALEIVQGLK